MSSPLFFEREPLVYLQALTHLQHLADFSLVVIPVRVCLCETTLRNKTLKLLQSRLKPHLLFLAMLLVLQFDAVEVIIFDELVRLRVNLLSSCLLSFGMHYEDIVNEFVEDSIDMLAGESLALTNT